MGAEQSSDKRSTQSALQLQRVHERQGNGAGANADAPQKQRKASFHPSMLEAVPALNEYEVLNKLGQGSFGRVMLVRRKDNMELYALKMMD